MANDKLIQKILMEDDDLKKLLLSRLAEKDISTASLVIDDNYIEKLKSLATEYQRPIDFKVGDLVKWKQGLKNRRKPEYNQPAIVIEVLDKAIIANEDEPGSATFREGLSIILGLMTENNEFLAFHYDRKRFESFK